MKHKRIIYFVANEFSNRDYNRLGIEHCTDKGYCVEVWNFSTYLYDNTVQQNYINSKFILRTFDTKKEIINSINNLSQKDFIVNQVFFGIQTYFLYRMLKVNKIGFSQIYLGSIPSKCDTSFSTILKQGNMNFFKIYNFIFKKIISLLKIDIYPSFILVDGKKAPVAKSSRVVYAHSYDYDLYLKEQTLEKIKRKNKFIVFLDVNLVDHTDFKILNLHNPVTKEKYYSSLTKYFENIREATGLNIIIVAHPRTDYDKLQKEFKSFKIVQNNTNKLIAESEFVISHDTTAISLVVLNNKPIQFITTDELIEAKDTEIECMANYFDKQVINIDDLFYFDKIETYRIPEKRYKEYIEDYIKVEDSPKKLLWDIFIDILEKEKINE